MYELHLKGKTIIELKKAVEDAAAELNGFTGTTIGMRVEKSVHTAPTPVAEVEEDNEVYVDESEIGQSLRAATADLDSEGIPWDVRIHSSSKAKNNNGSWKLKKNVDKSIVNSVKVELRGSSLGHTNSAAPVSPVSHAQIQTPNVIPMRQEPAVQPMQPQQQTWGPQQPAQPQFNPQQNWNSAPVQNPAPVAAPVQPVQQPAYVAPPIPQQQFNGGYTFESFKGNFAMVLTGLINSKKIDQNYINTLKGHWGVNEIWDLNDAQMAEAFSSFAAWGFITAVQ